jgi:hypothetical protein
MSDISSLEGSSKKSLPEISVSSKPWHLTWDRDNKNLFVWKAGRRVSIGEGASSGAVSGVEVLGSNAVKVNSPNSLHFI